MEWLSSVCEGGNKIHNLSPTGKFPELLVLSVDFNLSPVDSWGVLPPKSNTLTVDFTVLYV